MSVLTVYHGTGVYSLPGIRSRGLETRRRHYAPRPCACVTTDPAIARQFARRKTSIEDYLAGRLTGVVLEFTLSGVAGRDHAPARDPSVTEDEKEVAVYNPKRLALVAVWHFDGREWSRKEES